MKRYYCPNPDATDCPYFSHSGRCTLVNEGYDPIEECDDAYEYDPDGENWDDDEEDYSNEEQTFMISVLNYFVSENLHDF